MKIKPKTALLICLLVLISSAGAQSLSDDALAQIRFDQKLNAQVSLALPFRDEDGREVRLAQYFSGKPVLLVLGYYECPMLCTLVLNGMVESAADMKWSIGREFEVVNVSISPGESPTLAAAKKRTYLRRYGRTGAAQGWHFLTGNEPAIRQLAEEAGFHYAYDSASKQYAHPSGLIVLTPEGKISRYLFGVTFSPKDLYGALRDASSSRVGSPIQQFILLCFHYNPMTGKYSGVVMLVLRLFAGVTLLVFVSFIFRWARQSGSAQASSAVLNQLDRELTPATGAPGSNVETSGQATEPSRAPDPATRP